MANTYGIFLIASGFAFLQYVLYTRMTAICSSASKPKSTRAAVPETTASQPRVISNSKVIILDGFVRNCVTGNVVGKIPDLFQSSILKSGVNTSNTETGSHRKASFKKIFSIRDWANKKDKDSYSGLSASGSGSTLQYAQEVIVTLHSIVGDLKERLGRKRIQLLDLACGDMQWMSRFLETRDDVDYTGFDVVPEMIHHHRERFAGKPWKFEYHDMVSDPLPNENYDLILARHVFMHLTTGDVIRVLELLSKSSENTTSGSRFLIATTFSEIERNQELVLTSPGRHRRLNLEIPPLSLTPPICIFSDGPSHKDQYLGLWLLPLRSVLGCSEISAFTMPLGRISSCLDWSLSAEELENKR